MSHPCVRWHARKYAIIYTFIYLNFEKPTAGKIKISSSRLKLATYGHIRDIKLHKAKVLHIGDKESEFPEKEKESRRSDKEAARELFPPQFICIRVAAAAAAAAASRLPGHK